MYRIKKILLSLFFLFPLFIHAQNRSDVSKKWYRSDAGDVCLFSFSNVSRNGVELRDVSRFIYMNSTTYLNKDFSNRAGFLTGFSVNNIGLIYDENDSVRFKRRVITAGLSAGLKFGNLSKGSYFFVEGQMNFALNYKEKRFVNDKKIEKSNTWFGEQTPLLMPSVSAGWLLEGIGLKAQYFPGNFFNPDYQEGIVKPFAGMESQIFLISFSYNMKSTKRTKTKKAAMSFEKTDTNGKGMMSRS